MARSNPTGEIVIALLMILGGAWVVGRELFIWRDAFAARGWAVTRGIVAQSDGSCSRRRRGRGKSCSIRGGYNYEVLSNGYVGHRFTLDDIDVGSPTTLDSLVRRFWPGTQIVVIPFSSIEAGNTFYS